MTIENPDNLPVIEETSLHKIVDTVKKWQLIDTDKTIVNGRYVYPDFNLIFDPININFLPICEFLEVEIDENNQVSEITSKKPFYWKKWIDCSAFECGIYFKNINIECVNLSQCVFEKSVQFIGTSFNEFKIENSNFKSVLYLHGSRFNKIASFFGTVFDGKIIFSDLVTGIAELITGSDFNKCIFKNEVDFSNAIFRRDSTFCEAVFQDNVDFSGIKFDKMLNLESVTFKGDVKINDIEILDCREINFNNSTFEKKLFFSLKDDTKENYGKVTLNLYHASIQDFVCDDRNLGEIKLYYPTNIGSLTESEINLINKDKDCKDKEEAIKRATRDMIEKAIAERRVFRKILQDLNWGDLADLEYAKIMELQTKLKIQSDKKKNRVFGSLEAIFFGWWLGWGVRVLPNLDQGVWKSVKKGGIIWSSLILICVLAFILQLDKQNLFPDSNTGFILTKQFLFIFTQQIPTPNKNLFIDLINLVFSSSAETTFQTFVVILGFIQMNLFLVILARKFMRM